MTERSQASGESLAQKLGWFSIGIGAVELLAPGWLARCIGLPDDGEHPVMRGFGLRELATGIGIITSPQPAPWIWTRVLGDALDLTALGCALSEKDADRLRLGLVTAAMVGVTAADIVCANQLGGEQLNSLLTSKLATKLASSDPVPTTKTVIIGKPAEELYRFWRDFSRLPEIMAYLERVEVTSDRYSHWVSKGPAGSTPEWDAEITEDEPGKRIAWRSLGGDIGNSGSIDFAPSTGKRGTVVTVTLFYHPPGGSAGVKLAKLLGREPGQMVAASLRAFKQVMETGEVVHSDASIHTGMHPAVPPAEFTRVKPGQIVGGESKA